VTAGGSTPLASHQALAGATRRQASAADEHATVVVVLVLADWNEKLTVCVAAVGVVAAPDDV
jgi:hypothetical protein